MNCPVSLVYGWVAVWARDKRGFTLLSAILSPLRILTIGFRGIARVKRGEGYSILSQFPCNCLSISISRLAIRAGRKRIGGRLQPFWGRARAGREGEYPQSSRKSLAISLLTIFLSPPKPPQTPTNPFITTRHRALNVDEASVSHKSQSFRDTEDNRIGGRVEPVAETG